VATGIHGNVKGLFFLQHFPSITVVPAFAGMTNTGVHTKREVMFRRDQPIDFYFIHDNFQSVRPEPVEGFLSRHALASTGSARTVWGVAIYVKLNKTSPERQRPLAEPSLHVCTKEPSHPSPNRLVFRCFLGDFFCTSKRSYLAAGPRPGAVHRMSTQSGTTQAQLQ
jgi:hypothetical protein